ncbi:hypothetical protein DV532_26885 (plasmid) [Pseudomonas sp. Leaf58]|uniref:hypothetical protein n=1 Tax=Pseudomonas sp. Leaf58 TaxID=1736226 RepID=UPI0006FBAFFA|nr:hypothetical protein [Pseudomonas sp. Leaf58]AYG47911.1 hypothetical protein DV532_26885 [Pseudomonas sp. Leaf58]KQN62524.1 hypothetical protein ASF02_10280 [Pseudomonas sp. Leaf58]
MKPGNTEDDQAADVPAEVVFTANEAQVMLHRLELLEHEEHCEEVFDSVDAEWAAEYAGQLVKLIEAEVYVFPLPCTDALEVLAESLEGSTFFGDVDDANKQGQVTKQKMAAYKRAAGSAAAKIEKLIGRRVVAALS